MPDPSSPSITAFPDLEALSRAAARHLQERATAVLRTREQYTLALAGGSTPRTLYRLLAGDAGDALPWDRVHLFWGDERYVPHDHPKSNVRMVRDTLLSERSVPPSNVHPIPVGPSPDAAAAAYTNTLQRFFDSPRQTFDTALLGLGSDGHTASLFPESLFPETSLSALEDWVGVVEAPPRHDVSTRLTCTLPVLNGASEVIFLVSGARKHDALTGVVDQHDAALPATHVQAREATRWFVDEAAYTGRA